MVYTRDYAAGPRRSVTHQWIELALCFGVLPTLFAVAAHRFNYRGAMAPVLWLLAALVGVVLYHDPSFDRARLWHLPWGHPYVARMLLRLGVYGSGILLLGR